MVQAVKNLTAVWETWVQSQACEDPLELGMATHSSYSCLENSHGQRSLAGYSPWGGKELDKTEQLSTTTDIYKTHTHKHTHTHIYIYVFAHVTQNAKMIKCNKKGMQKQSFIKFLERCLLATEQ